MYWAVSRIFNDLKERMMINITEEQLKEIVTQAHMAGQHNQAHCDPSYFEAEVHWQKQVKNIAYEPVLASVNSELKETYLRRIRTANEMIDNPSTPEEQKQRLRTKVSCYKYFVVELER